MISSLTSWAWLLVPGLFLGAMLVLWKRTRLSGLLWISAGLAIMWAFILWAAVDWLIPGRDSTPESAEMNARVMEQQFAVQLAASVLVAVGSVFILVSCLSRSRQPNKPVETTAMTQTPSKTSTAPLSHL